MGGLGAEVAHSSLWEDVRVHRSGRAGAVARKTRSPIPRPALPDWVRILPPPEQAPPRPLAPSSLGADTVANPPLPPSAAAAARRGTLLHALFERLPAVEAERRREIAEAWLAQPGREPDADKRDRKGARLEKSRQEDENR